MQPPFIETAILVRDVPGDEEQIPRPASRTSPRLLHEPRVRFCCGCQCGSAVQRHLLSIECGSAAIPHGGNDTSQNALSVQA